MRVAPQFSTSKTGLLDQPPVRARSAGKGREGAHTKLRWTEIEGGTVSERYNLRVSK